MVPMKIKLLLHNLAWEVPASDSPCFPQCDMETYRATSSVCFGDPLFSQAGFTDKLNEVEGRVVPRDIMLIPSLGLSFPTLSAEQVWLTLSSGQPCAWL